MQMSGPPVWPGEGSKQPQVSALPERRVKKRLPDGTLGTFFYRRTVVCPRCLRGRRRLIFWAAGHPSGKNVMVTRTWLTDPGAFIRIIRYDAKGTQSIV